MNELPSTAIAEKTVFAATSAMYKANGISEVKSPYNDGKVVRHSLIIYTGFF